MVTRDYITTKFFLNPFIDFGNQQQQETNVDLLKYLSSDVIPHGKSQRGSEKEHLIWSPGILQQWIVHMFSVNTIKVMGLSSNE